MPTIRLPHKLVLLVAVACLIFYCQPNPSPAQPPQGPGGPNAPDIMLVKKFDADKDGLLDDAERAEARKEIKKLAGDRGGRRGGRGQGGRGGFGGPGGRGGQRGPGPRGSRGDMPQGSVGTAVKSQDVTHYAEEALYDPQVLRTLFLEFENEQWEQELADFKPTDVEVPATLRVDGKTYPNVGVSFRGASSFFTVPAGLKRSLNISMDYLDQQQRLYDYKSLNLLNCNGDPSMMSSILYSIVARKKIAAPKVNFVKVVINGRSWGIYVNSQQFNKDFLQENFETRKGARWKVSGSPNGDGGLRYLGDDFVPYRQRFEIKSKDKDESWAALVNLCKVLNETPIDELEDAITPILDVEGALWFLAADVVLVNSDGYWTRASDYSIYLSPDGKFSVIPHDMNESFRDGHGGHGGGGPPGFGGPPPGFGPPPEGGPTDRSRGMRRPNGPRGDGPSALGGGPPRFGGPGGPQGRGGGPGGDRPQRGAGQGGVDLDPLVGIDDPRIPLRSKLLKVPKFRALYLKNVREIATDLQQWETGLGAQVAEFRKLIEKEVVEDTRKLTTNQAFKSATSSQKKPNAGSLQEFAHKRARYLLNHKAIESLSP